MTMGDAIQDWMVSTPINQLVIGYAWSWPTLESLHFLALCLLMGSLLIMDLRLDRLSAHDPAQGRARTDAGRDRLVRDQPDHGSRVPVRRSAHLHGELGVLGEDVLRRPRGPELPGLLHEVEPSLLRARSERPDAGTREGRWRRRR